jgi:hypothetical protein
VKQKKLAGQVVLEHDSLRVNFEDDIIIHINDTVNKAKNEDGYCGKDFYIVLITTIDRVLR